MITERKPVKIIEFLGDGNAIVRRTDDSETMMMAREELEMMEADDVEL